MNADAIFAAANEAGERVQRFYKRRELRSELFDLLHRCGSCAAWMKKQCPRERRDDLAGVSRGPSCQEMKCSQFVLSDQSQKHEASLRKQLEKLEAMEF